MECNETTRDSSDHLKSFSPLTSFRQFMLKSQSGSQSVEIFCSPSHKPSVKRLIMTRNDSYNYFILGHTTKHQTPKNVEVSPVFVQLVWSLSLVKMVLVDVDINI